MPAHTAPSADNGPGLEPQCMVSGSWLAAGIELHDISPPPPWTQPPLGASDPEISEQLEILSVV